MASAGGKKPVMDVTRPGKTAANPTSRPVIIGHGSVIKDPVVKQESNNGLEDQEPSHQQESRPIKAFGKTVQPLGTASSEPVAKTEESASETQTKTTDTNKAEPAAEKTTQEAPQATEATSSEDAAIVDAVAEQAGANKRQKEEDEAELKRRESLEKLIAEKKYFLSIKQQSDKSGSSKGAVAVLILLLLLVGVYCAIDAGVVDVGIDMPLHIFK